MRGTRRVRTLGLGATVRAFNELAVPGMGGVWFAQQLILALLGIRLAEAVRADGHRILISSGFLVGESLTGVVIALSDTIARRSGSLSLHTNANSLLAKVIGILAFSLLLSAFYEAISRETVRVPQSRSA